MAAQQSPSHADVSSTAAQARVQQPRTLRDVVFVEGVRTPFGKAGEKGQYAQTRADDLVVKVIRELLRRHPGLPPERIDEVAIAAATQTGDQGLTIGRTAAILAGLPRSVPGFAIDRMCAGAMTAVTTVASGIAVGAYDVAIAGGVEHMGHHPMGEGADPNPRFVADRLVDPSALNMGNTAENLHDRYPQLTKERADAFAVRQPGQVRRRTGRRQDRPGPGAGRDPIGRAGLGPGRPATSSPGPAPRSTALESLRTPFRPHGRVSAGNASGLTDGATGCLLVAADVAEELGLPVRMRMVSFAFAGVDPETMGDRTDPGHRKGLAQGRSDDRRHRPDRDQRGVRGAGAGLHRPLRTGRRRPAGQPLRRRHRHGPPAGRPPGCG